MMVRLRFFPGKKKDLDVFFSVIYEKNNILKNTAAMHEGGNGTYIGP